MQTRNIHPRMGQYLRRWTNIEQTLGEPIVFAGRVILSFFFNIVHCTITCECHRDYCWKKCPSILVLKEGNIVREKRIQNRKQ